MPPGEYAVFEPVLDAPANGGGQRSRRRHRPDPPEALPSHFEVVAAHSEMQFYTWGSRTCWLRQGATSATLLDAWADDKPADPEYSSGGAPERRLRRLRAGDVLILEERRSAATGAAADADRSHRHAVRLTAVEPVVDPLYGGSRGRPVVNVAWAAADASSTR